MIARIKSSTLAAALRLATIAPLFVGCGSDDSAAPSEDEHSADHEDLEDDDDFMGCPPGIPPFQPGMHAAGKQFAVKLLSAMPAAPERYTNNWTVELDQTDGTPAADAQIKMSQTFMPVHGHDGRVVPEVSALEKPGQFKVDKVTFTMRGPWEARFWLNGTSGDEDYVVLQVCVEK